MADRIERVERVLWLLVAFELGFLLMCLWPAYGRVMEWMANR